MSYITEFGRPMVVPGRKGLRTISQLYWIDSKRLVSSTIGTEALVSPGQRHTSAIDSSVPPAAGDSPPANATYKFFGAFLTGMQIEKTGRNDGRTLISRTFEELNDGTVDNTALTKAGPLTYDSGTGIWSASGADLASPAFAGRTFEVIIPFRFPGVYNGNPPVVKKVPAIIMELFFLANPPSAVLGYEPIRWMALTEQYTPVGQPISITNKYYYPGYLSNGYGLSAFNKTYKGVPCSTVVLSSDSDPVNYPAAGYQMVQTAKSFYGPNGLLRMRRDVYVPF